MTAALFGVRATLMCAIGAVDARERRLPNALAAALCLLCAAEACVSGGPALLAVHALAALTACGFLMGFEFLWRSHHGGMAGMGMGDIKYLFGLMIAEPVLGLVSFAGGLCLLAVSGAVVRVRSLPLLPFAVMSYAGFVIAARLLL